MQPLYRGQPLAESATDVPEIASDTVNGRDRHRNVAHLLFGEKTVAITQIGDSMGTPLNIARGIVLGTSVTRR